jgi:DNA-binding transcriptional MerR regulator
LTLNGVQPVGFAIRTFPEIAREVGIAPSAIRFYERKGIMRRARRHANGYREYTDEDLCRLRIVVSLRQLGLDLPVAGRLASLCQRGRCDAMARDLLPLVSTQRAGLSRGAARISRTSTASWPSWR